MSGFVRPKARDAAERLIVEALRAAGASVALLDSDRDRGVPDLLVGRAGFTYLLEVKNPEATRSRRNKSGATIGKAGPTSLSPAQERWHRGWRGRKPVVVRTPAEALAVLARADLSADVRAPPPSQAENVAPDGPSASQERRSSSREGRSALDVLDAQERAAGCKGCHGEGCGSGCHVEAAAGFVALGKGGA